MDDVGEGRRQAAERGVDVVRGGRLPGPDHHRQDDDLAVVLLGDERHRWAVHHVRDRRQLVRSRLGRGDEAGHGLRRRRQDEDAADDPGKLLEPIAEAGGDAEVPAAAPDRPEEVRLVVGVDSMELPVGGDDVGRQEAVDRQPVLADEVADPTAEGWGLPG